MCQGLTYKDKHMDSLNNNKFTIDKEHVTYGIVFRLDPEFRQLPVQSGCQPFTPGWWGYGGEHAFSDIFSIDVHNNPSTLSLW